MSASDYLINPETLSLAAAVAIGGIGLFFLSSTSSATGVGGSVKKNSTDNYDLLPPDFLGLGSGTSTERAKTFGYNTDPDYDPADSAICVDNSGFNDPNKSLLEKLFDALTPIGWGMDIATSVSRKNDCKAAATAEIARDMPAADEAYARGDYKTAYELLSTATHSQIQIIDDSDDPVWTQKVILYSTAYYTFVVCKTQLEQRRTLYAMLCDEFNDTSVNSSQVRAKIAQVNALTLGMTAGAVSYFIAFRDPDSDIVKNCDAMYVASSSPARGTLKFDASKNIILTSFGQTTDVVDTTTSAGISSGGFIPVPRADSDANLRTCVLSADPLPLLKAAQSTLSTVDFTAFYSKVVQLRDAYKRYMKGVQAYRDWQSSSDHTIVDSDVRQTVADGASAYGELPGFIVTDTYGIKSALYDMDSASRAARQSQYTTTPNGVTKTKSPVDSPTRSYSGQGCNYGGCD